MTSWSRTSSASSSGTYTHRSAWVPLAEHASETTRWYIQLDALMLLLQVVQVACCTLADLARHSPKVSNVMSVINFICIVRHAAWVLSHNPQSN